MAEAPTSAPSAAASVAILKQVKAAESEWSAKLADARKDAEAMLARLRQDADDSVRAAGARAEADRTRALEAARTGVQSEVAEILEEGERAAATAGRATGKRPQDRRDPVIGVVLGPFAGSS